MPTDDREACAERTLAREVVVRGVGLHTGAPAAVTLRPAPAGAGITFVAGGTRFRLQPGCVVDTRRCTAVGHGAVRVDTVEHLLAALAAHRIFAVEVEVDGPEVPALDGSGAPWDEAVRGAGTLDLDAAARPWTLAEPVCVHVGASWMAAAPADALSIECVCPFGHPLLGIQAVRVEGTTGAFSREVAPARTFGLIEEVEALRATGLALGGSLDNALVVYPDRYSSPLRLPDECVRHKVLDLWGDLAVLGAPLVARVFGYRPGHAANARLVEALARSGSRAAAGSTQ